MTSVLDLPSTRQEAWRWSDPQAIAAAAASTHQESDLDPDSLFLDLDGPRLLFVDGVFDAGQSEAGTVSIGPLAIGSDHPLGRKATGPGWRLALGREHATGPVQIVHLSTGADNHLPAEIVLEEDAAASLVETFAGSGGWANRLTRISLGRSARLMRSVRLLQAEGFVSVRDEAVVGQGASLVSTLLGAGDMGSRYDAELTLEGEGAFAEVGGALLARGDRKQEAAVVVRHAAPGGTSRQLWRLVAGDRAVASAAARVEVARGAQRTDGEQSLRGLLLDRTATVNLKPELEIFADDVKCAHGATVGELDAQALFYLASRGIPPVEARALLTRAFVGDALARIGQDVVRDAFERDADRWLEARA